jgi:phenylalanine-4-hydroxylase
METAFLPPHLRKYVVEQNYEKYTPIDQAVWRYILRQLRDYLGTHAHESYLEGLEKTGIEIDTIPRIENISRKIQEFGWRALPVSGFIPPAAFMELQSLGVLPIASDMRSLDHLLYTPAPDIVHEAAGHAPILVNAEFAEYLRHYAAVAKKAIISKEDLDVYEAIRDLSDLKENPTSTKEEITAAEKRLGEVTNQVSHISEASELSRMNWWTAEYGLIGDTSNPKIYGAGLLSSVGEAKHCLRPAVKKIPLSLECLDFTYDITEQQPQLFVTPSFKHLVEVLDQMAEKMAFRVGGKKGLDKAILAKSVNTAELNSGLQISGQISGYLEDEKGQIAYLKFSGPSQLSFADQELKGHGKDYHKEGFGTPMGELKGLPGKCPSKFTEKDWAALNVAVNKPIQLEFTSGVIVTGTLESLLQKNGKTLLLTLKNAKATFKGETLFDPSWGTFDMALGSAVPSVFGGPADREAYGETVDFVAKRVPQTKYSAKELKLHQLYKNLREWRENKISGDLLEKNLSGLIADLDKDFAEDWLLRLEALELLTHRLPQSTLHSKVEKDLQSLTVRENYRGMINDGLKLLEVVN